jgi:hypothetical protein
MCQVFVIERDYACGLIVPAKHHQHHAVVHAQELLARHKLWLRATSNMRNASLLMLLQLC